MRRRPKAPAAIVDVTMQMQEGKRFFVNRITFIGNTTTRDNVDPPRDAPGRRRRLQHGGAEVQRQAAQSARVLQAARRQGKDIERQQGAERDRQGRRQAEARRAEPQSADLRRRRVAVRGLLRPAVVPDVELPRTRREPDAVAAGRVAGAELHARVHRAVPVRSQHHRRRQPVQAARSTTSASSRSSRPAATLTFGCPARRGFSRVFINYSYQRVRVTDINRRRTSIPTCSRAIRSCFDSLLHRRRAASAPSARSTPRYRLQHGRQPDLPDQRQALSRSSIDLAGLGGNTSFYKPTARRRLVLASRPAA